MAVGTGRAHGRVFRAGLVVVALLGSGAPAAACGGGRSGHVASLGTTTTTVLSSAAKGGSAPSPSNRALAFVNCLRTHGEPDMPDPVIGGRTVSLNIPSSISTSPQFPAAYAACKHLLPDNGVPKGNAITPADQADYLKAAACMRSHGVLNFPDPVFENGSVAFRARTPIDTNSSEYKSALATCQKLIPAGLPYSSSG
jgi:hypothetical protein